MLRRDFLIGASAFAAVPILPATAAEMQSFAVNPLADPVWKFASWPSTANRIAKNQHGTFYAIAVSQNDPINYQSGNFVILRDIGTGPQPFWSGNLPTNLLCLEAFDAGELHAVYSSLASPQVTDMVWANPSTSAVPVVNTITGTGTANGKIGTFADDARRALYVIGTAGYFFRFDAAGTARPSQQVFLATTSTPNYFALTMDPAGSLYIVMGNAVNGASPPDYDCITAILTPNPKDSVSSWYCGPWVIGTAPVTLPIDPTINGPAVLITTGEQMRLFNNSLGSAVFAQDRLHVSLSEYFANQRGFDFDDLRDLSSEIVSIPFSGHAALTNGGAYINRPLRGATLRPRCATSIVAERGEALYTVQADRTHLLALKSIDGGKRWTDYAATEIVGLGTDTIHFLSACRGRPTDTSIDGMFTVLHCTPTQWAYGTAPVPPAIAADNPTATAYRFSLPTA